MKYILDSGMGTELEAREINIPDWKKSIWSANALIHSPDIIRDIHIENIKAGSNVITTNNYYVTPNILKRENLESNFVDLVQRSIDIAKEAKSEFDNILIAGSFPPIETSFRPDLTPKDNELISFYSDLLEIMYEQVDLILCETMCSIREGTIASEVASEKFNEVWLSWNTRSADGSKLPSGELLEDAINAGNKIGVKCQLLNCTATNLVTNHLEKLKKANEFGVYANSREYKELDLIEDLGEEVDPDIYHYHNTIEISPSEYAEQAKIWVDEGAYVIGGCCDTGPKHIRALVEMIS